MKKPSILRYASLIPCCEQEPKAQVNFALFPGKKPLTGLQRAGKRSSINMAQKLFFRTPMPEPWDLSSEMPGILFSIDLDPPVLTAPFALRQKRWAGKW